MDFWHILLVFQDGTLTADAIWQCDNPRKHAEIWHVKWKCDTLALGQFGSPRRPGGECFAPCFDHMDITTWWHCAPAQRNRILNGHLPYGDVISRQKIMISENQEYWSTSIPDHSNDFLIVPRHDLDGPESILGSSFFHHFHDFENRVLRFLKDDSSP